VRVCRSRCAHSPCNGSLACASVPWRARWWRTQWRGMVLSHCHTQFHSSSTIKEICLSLLHQKLHWLPFGNTVNCVTGLWITCIYRLQLKIRCTWWEDEKWLHIHEQLRAGTGFELGRYRDQIKKKQGFWQLLPCSFFWSWKWTQNLQNSSLWIFLHIYWV